MERRSFFGAVFGAVSCLFCGGKANSVRATGDIVIRIHPSVFDAIQLSDAPVGTVAMWSGPTRDIPKGWTRFSGQSTRTIRCMESSDSAAASTEITSRK